MSPRCEQIADTSDHTFSTYSDVRKWEQWDEPRMSKIRDHIRSIFETRDTNPVVITGSNACDETMPSLIPPEFRVARVQGYATSCRKECAKKLKKAGGDGIQFSPDTREMDYLNFPVDWLTTPTFSLWLTNWHLIL